VKKRKAADEIVAMVREAENEMAKGTPVDEVCRKLNVAPATLVRWRHRYGGLSTPEAKRLKELERENAALHKLVARAELEKQILREALKHLGKG
jgi:putative transposase